MTLVNACRNGPGGGRPERAQGGQPANKCRPAISHLDATNPGQVGPSFRVVGGCGQNRAHGGSNEEGERGDRTHLIIHRVILIGRVICPRCVFEAKS